MADEPKTESAGIMPDDLGDQIFNDAMEMFRKETATETKEEAPVAAAEIKPEDQPQEEVKEEIKEEVKEVEPTETPQPEAEENKAEAGTEKPEEKKPYTPEEIKAIAATGDFSKFDVSRLTPGEQAAMRSMQAGLTPKLQEAAELRKERDTLAQRIRAEEEKRAKEEAAKLYDREREEYGDEIANSRKEVRELKDLVQSVQRDRESEKAAMLAEQQGIAAQQFHYTFKNGAKGYGLPDTPEMEEMVMSKVLAENTIRYKNGEQLISADDGMRMVADTMGFSNPDKLLDLLAANPKLLEAIENRLVEKSAKKRAAGPTVVKTSGGSSKNEVKPNTGDDELKKLLDIDPNEYAVQYALRLSKAKQ